MSDTAKNKNLVRGASTSQRTQSITKDPRSDNLLIEEEPRSHPRGEHSQSSLVGNAAPMGRSSQYQDLGEFSLSATG